MADAAAVSVAILRLAHGREASRDGSGLGLGIARGILREHGGDVRLDNHPQGGLVATVRLPAPSGDGRAPRLP